MPLLEYHKNIVSMSLEKIEKLILKVEQEHQRDLKFIICYT